MTNPLRYVNGRGPNWTPARKAALCRAVLSKDLQNPIMQHVYDFSEAELEEMIRKHAVGGVAALKATKKVA